MILSVSRRTDVPKLYSEWLINRLAAGYCVVRNPMNHAMLSRIPLTPDVVDCIVFWTKDPEPMLARLDEIDAMGYPYYFQFTLTPYGTDLERNLRPKREIIDTFIRLSGKIGRERVVWRYDPIVLNDSYTLARHEKLFLRLCELLSPYTDTVVISFVDLYKKLNSPLVLEISEAEIMTLAGFIGETARRFGLRAVTCSEAADLSRFGIGRSSCIDKARIERILGCRIDAKPDKNQRSGCGCIESIDIGAYDTCTNGCLYCYANRSIAAAARNFAVHDPSGELLFGKIGEGEIIRERAVRRMRG